MNKSHSLSRLIISDTVETLSLIYEGGNWSVALDLILLFFQTSSVLWIE